MNVRAGAGFDLDCGVPAIFGQVHRNPDVLVFNRPGGRNLEVLGHRVDRVGFADRPAVGQRRHLRHVGHVALRRAAVDPRNDRLDFIVGQTRVVAEDAVRHVRPPRRHGPRGDALLDRAQPRTRIFVRRQRHRREHRRAMALDARLVQDRRDILREGRRAVGRQRRLASDQACGDQTRDDHQTHGECSLYRHDSSPHHAKELPAARRLSPISPECPSEASAGADQNRRTPASTVNMRLLAVVLPAVSVFTRVRPDVKRPSTRSRATSTPAPAANATSNARI
jgi:hypothetical protein